MCEPKSQFGEGEYSRHKPLVDDGHEAVDEAVGGDGVEDARQREHAAEEAGGEAADGADGHDVAGPVGADVAEGLGHGRQAVDEEVGQHEAEDGRDAAVGHGAHEQRQDDADGDGALRVLHLYLAGGNFVENFFFFFFFLHGYFTNKNL